MYQKLFLFVFLAILFLPVHLFAIEISEAVITTSIVDREPIDSVEVFPRQNGKLYCFSRVIGAQEETFVYHLWYRQDQLVSRVELPVKSEAWRTWSAKQLLEDWPGEWRVEIQDVDGNTLREVKFELR